MAKNQVVLTACGINMTRTLFSMNWRQVVNKVSLHLFSTVASACECYKLRSMFIHSVTPQRPLALWVSTYYLSLLLSNKAVFIRHCEIFSNFASVPEFNALY